MPDQNKTPVVVRETIPNIYHGHRIDGHHTANHGIWYSVYGKVFGADLGPAIDWAWNNRYTAPPEGELGNVYRMALDHKRPVYWPVPPDLEEQVNEELRKAIAESRLRKPPAAVAQSEGADSTGTTSAAMEAVQAAISDGLARAKDQINAAAAAEGVKVEWQESTGTPEQSSSNADSETT